MRTYDGTCLCKKVRFAATVLSEKLLSCQCSYCTMRNLTFVLAQWAHFKIFSGEQHLSEYKANENDFRHLFCTHCGVEPFAYVGQQSDLTLVAINVYSLIELDVQEFKTLRFDCSSVIELDIKYLLPDWRH